MTFLSISAIIVAMDKKPQTPENSIFSYENYLRSRSIDGLDINNTNYDSGKDYQVHVALSDKVNEAQSIEETKHGLGKLVARHATRQASNTLDRHNTMIKAAYSADGGLANEFAYDDANNENEEYDLNVSLGKMADDLSKEWGERKDEVNFESLGNFGKLDFIYNFAKELSDNKKVPYIKSDRNSVTIDGSYLTYEIQPFGGDAIPVARKIRTTIIKGDDGLFEINLTKRDKEYEDKNAGRVIWYDSIKLAKAYGSRDYAEVRRKGLTVAVKEVLSKEKPLSDEEVIYRSDIKPEKRVLVSKQGNGSLLTPSHHAGLPEGTKIFSRKTGKEVERELGDYKEKPESKQDVEEFVDRLAKYWIHGVVVFPGLA